MGIFFGGVNVLGFLQDLLDLLVEKDVISKNEANKLILKNTKGGGDGERAREILNA